MADTLLIDILKLTLGPVQTNCYIVAGTDTGDAIVIDPVDNAPLILKTVQQRGWRVREILATHAHFDHIMASAELKDATGAPFRLHRADEPLRQAMPQQVMQLIGIDVPPAAEPDSYLTEGDHVTAGTIDLAVLFTPGHSPGHVSFVLTSERTVFCGDVLFAGSIGRTDLPGGDYETLMESIATRLLPLGDDYAVLPGHMQNTTLGHERATNPYVVDYLRARRD
ncbi:MAG: MBL fold metallo-hydrolase [Chloroflexota bacterium]|nr:MBL fold metallo-hydrolase [Anaerolineae bacterium]HMM27319.1 MBL fold metallo-hydrolase [Aggregatilineaceae bacterium]